MAAPTPNTSTPVTSFTIDANIAVNIKAIINQADSFSTPQGAKWGGAIGTGATIYYSFPTSNASSIWSTDYTEDTSSELYNRFSGLTTAQRTAATASVQSWSSVANVNLTLVTTESSSAVGDIRLANTSGFNMDAGTYAYAYLPNGEAYGGDLWINAVQPISTGNNYDAGGAGFHTILHELGHTLGLGHPFEGSVTLSPSLETYKYTVMSYSDAPSHEDTGFSSFYPTTPMLLDIQAMQYLYGANMTYKTGNDTYVFNGASTYYQAIWDAGGIDTIAYSSTTGGIINLNAGSFSSMGAPITLSTGGLQYDNIAIAYNVTIENAIGGQGDDVIYGNTASNGLVGGDGNDVINGAGGNDVIDGGAGADMATFSVASTALSNIRYLKTGGALITTSEGSDTLINIENLNFSNGNFTIEALISARPLPTYTLNTGSTSPMLYSGPVAFLEYQYLGAATGDVVVTASAGNDFINLLAGDDAANGGLGDDVLDGGIGSNFLTGGGDNDTFYLDGRGGTTTWATITDFNSGDAVNIWGWNAGTSKLLLTQASAGAVGFTGVTFHYDLNNDNSIDTSITFTGLSAAQVPASQALSVVGNGYLLIG